MIVDARAAHGEVDRDIVLNLPDRSDEGRAGPKQANIALIEDFGGRPHDPISRALNDRVEKVVGVLLPSERSGGIEVYRSPAPPLRGDAGKTNAGAALVMDPRQQDTEFGCDAGPGFLLQAALAQHAFEKSAVANQAGPRSIGRQPV